MLSREKCQELKEAGFDQTVFEWRHGPHKTRASLLCPQTGELMEAVKDVSGFSLSMHRADTVAPGTATWSGRYVWVVYGIVPNVRPTEATRVSNPDLDLALAELWMKLKGGRP